jgi:hypothetical protein
MLYMKLELASTGCKYAIVDTREVRRAAMHKQGVTLSVLRATAHTPC